MGRIVSMGRIITTLWVISNGLMVIRIIIRVLGLFVVWILWFWCWFILFVFAVDIEFAPIALRLCSERTVSLCQHACDEGGSGKLHSDEFLELSRCVVANDDEQLMQFS